MFCKIKSASVNKGVYLTSSSELWSYPGYFWEPHWLSMRLPKISRATLTCLQLLRRMLHFQRNQQKPQLWRTVAVLGTCMLIHFITLGWNMDHIVICLCGKTECGKMQDSNVQDMVLPWHWFLFIPRTKTNSFMIICQIMRTGERYRGLAYIATPKVVFLSHYLIWLPVWASFTNWGPSY